MNIISPHRVTHTFTQHLVGTPDDVFPLLCPVREAEWVNGWNPRVVITSSGVAEHDCVFVMGGTKSESVWMVTQYEPPARIEFIKVTPAETVARVTIELRAGEVGETLADVTYAYTALNEAGTQVVDSFTAEYYHAFMTEWEDELNHYIRTGTKLVAAPAELEETT
jgi:hypothetical protein